MKYIVLILLMYSCSECAKGHYEIQVLPMAFVDANGMSTTILLPQKVWVCDSIKINK